MSSKTKRSCKPNLMVLLSFFVGLGMLLTSLAQAAEPSRSAVPDKAGSQQRSWTEQWLRSVWGLDLAAKIKNWKPRVRVDSDGEGLRLSHPFGNHGPALRLSTSIPERAQLSLRAGGDNQVGNSGADEPGPYLFLQKRW
jgi:hypothetical protein